MKLTEMMMLEYVIGRIFNIFVKINNLKKALLRSAVDLLNAGDYDSIKVY